MTGYEHLFTLLAEAERFIAGFEGDETQDEPVDGLLARIRAVLPKPVATLIEPEPKLWFRKEHECSCGCQWTDEWDCLCDDECPNCGADVSPSDWEEVDPD